MAEVTTARFAAGVLDYGGQVWNVKHPQFGAKGDGVTDDTQAITDARDKARADGGVVFFPPGTYAITSTIRLMGVPFVGAGQSVVTIKMLNTGSNDAGTILQTRPTTANEEDYSAVTDMTLDGNVVARSAEFTGACFGIFIRSSHCRVERVTLKGLGKVGLDDIDNGGIGLGIRQEETGAIQHVEGNVCRDIRIEDEDGILSFGYRVHSTFGESVGFDEDGFHTRHNHAERITVVGTVKNGFEIVGVNTIGNTVDDSEVVHFMGVHAFDADLGARHTRFRRCVVRGWELPPEDLRPVPELFCFRSGPDFDGSPNTANAAYGTVFEDCRVEDLDATVDTVAYGFVADGSVQTSFIRPRVQRATVSSGATKINGVWIKAAATSVRIEEPELDVSSGIVFGTTTVDCRDVRMLGGEITADASGWFCQAALGTVTGVEVAGTKMRVGSYCFNMKGEDDFYIHDCDLAFNGEVSSRPLIQCPEDGGKGWIEDNTLNISNGDQGAIVRRGAGQHVGSNELIVGSNAANNPLIHSGADFRGHVHQNFRADGIARGARAEVWGTDVPASGQWYARDIVWNATPTSGGPVGWVCVSSGEPGTWRPFGYVGPAANGTTTLESGNTSVAVTHGLGVTPALKDIHCQPIEAWGAMTSFYPSNPTSTQFTINADQDPGQDVDFSWSVAIR